jgi:hypothetical protein
LLLRSIWVFMISPYRDKEKLSVSLLRFAAPAGDVGGVGG